MIYTSVQYSLSDAEMGLLNQSGYNVYSCTQGMSRQDLQELVRFSSYRLPKNNTIPYSEVVGDPSVPGQFPKMFRTLKLKSGRYAAIQSAFAGVDYQNQPGNFFAHAFVFEDPDDDFFPEQYYGHEKFKTYLTVREAETKLVHYLPSLNDLEPTQGLEANILAFIDSHKSEMSYVLNKAVQVLTTEKLSHICIAGKDEETTVYYLLALKWLLPREISKSAGISTYNVYLPSDKQDSIIFHGTIKGKNNITEQALESRENCIYIDIDETDFSQVPISPILDNFEVKELRKLYGEYKISSVKQLLDWVAVYTNVTSPGMGAKLLNLKRSLGDEAFVRRSSELYKDIENEDMQPVKFEITKVMYDNVALFENGAAITDNYMSQGIEKLCSGEIYNMEDIFKGCADPKEQAQLIKDKLPRYMNTIRLNFDTIGQKNQLLLLRMFSLIKHELEIPTWKEFFDNNKSYLTLFTEMGASVLITSRGPRAFTAPSTWTKAELSELVAYFDSSTLDKDIKLSCLKYILNNEDEDWESYGISLTKRSKTKGEQESDMEKLKRMLTKVGYIPYQRNTYQSIKSEVINDVEYNSSPLLLSRLLYAVYKWQGTYGSQAQSQKLAGEIRDLLLEMKKTQTSCYDFIIPKLALEIIESPGHYHELMINTETMPPSFWNWFLIGYKNKKREEDKRLIYTRIYLANKSKMSRLPVRQRMRKTFQDVE